MVLMRSVTLPVATAALALSPAQAHAQVLPAITITWDAGNTNAGPIPRVGTKLTRPNGDSNK